MGKNKFLDGDRPPISSVFSEVVRFGWQNDLMSTLRTT
jgi:hypothetical protein